jgi:hypothetical protein
MPVSPEGAALAMASGLSAVCSSCAKYWEARDHGVPGSGCTTKVKCGSPMAGDTFSDYDGPLKGVLHLWCFVCAHPSELAIRVGGKHHLVGVCKEHLKYLKDFKAVGGPEIRAEVKTPNGPLLVSSSAPKKSLGQVIDEVEASYAEKEGRESEP